MEIYYFEDAVKEKEEKVGRLFELQLQAANKGDVELAIDLAIDIKKVKGTWTEEN